MASTPPLHLYRAILREHRKRLPLVMRKLGDDYVRSEFRSHKSAKAQEVTQFMNAWGDYLLKIRLQRDRFGSNLNDNVQKAFSEEQKKKLDELRTEALNSFKDKPATV